MKFTVSCWALAKVSRKANGKIDNMNLFIGVGFWAVYLKKEQ